MLAIKDMAGLVKPYAAEKLVKALRQEVGIPIHFHTHDTSGINAASVLKAADAGVHVADAAVASMSGQTSQPNLNSIVAALRHTRRAHRPHLDALNQYADYWEVVREFYAPFDTGPGAARRGISPRNARRTVHQSQGAGRIDGPGPALARARPHLCRRQHGLRGHREGDAFEQSGGRHGDLPGQPQHDHGAVCASHARSHAHAAHVGDRDVHGLAGRTQGGWPKKLQKIILRGAKPKRGRPGAHLPKVDLEETAASVEKKIGRRPSQDEDLSYLMYPDVFLKFAKAASPSAAWMCCQLRRSITVWSAAPKSRWNWSPARRWSIKFLTVGEPHPDGTRTVFFELNGQPREVVIRDRSLEVREPASPRPIRINPARSPRRFPAWFRL